MITTRPESVRLAAKQPCWNAEALMAYAEDHPEIGEIACTGCVLNPVVSRICSATADAEPICGPQETALGTGEALTSVQVPGFRLTEPQQTIVAA